MDKKQNTADGGARGTPNRRGAPRGPRKATERRAALLESAGRLFVDKGFDATTMEEIAAAAGFAKGTLYHYFSNKADLLMNLREEFDKTIARRILERVERCADNDRHGRLRAWITGAVEAYFAMSDLHDVVIYGTGLPFRNSMVHSEVTRSLAELVADGDRAGVWSVADSRWIAVMMFYCFRGGCDEAMTGAQRAEDVPGRLYPLFLRMLGAEE